ncbi:MAG TPA: hypothetical protein VFY37_07220 [Solirubrobacterales bacterium]|nr:hypothetical protein [Solirubrobacterales bacterium]
MRTSNFTKAIVSILVGAAIATVAPAAAQNGGPPAQDSAAASERAHGDQIALRRDGDRAVPFDPVVGAPLLRRNGSVAEPFLAQVGPPAAPRAADGFDWGDAAIGAAGAYVLILLASGAVVLIRRRRPPQRLAQHPA